MKVGKVSFGNLQISTKKQTDEILSNLDSERKRYLLKDIKYDSFCALKVCENNNVFINELSFDAPQKVEGDNLLAKVQKAIDILWSTKYPNHRTSGNSYYGGEVSAPTYPFGYSGGGWGY